jgi:hypothetical protein
MAGIERLTTDLKPASGGKLTVHAIHNNSFLDIL